LGFMAVVASSCGSYQNVSYYDRDGIYGDVDKPQNNNQNPQVSQQNNQYKEYFGSLQNNNEGVETFTDVENYKSNYDNAQQNNNSEYSNGYSGWGNNSSNVNINVYDTNWGWNSWNNYWNWNIGWGWNSWYGPNWGWGLNSWYGPNWGWGWNNWYGPTGDGTAGMEILGTIIIMRTEEGMDCTEDIQMVAIITTQEGIEMPIITLAIEIHIPTEVPTEALILTL